MCFFIYMFFIEIKSKNSKNKIYHSLTKLKMKSKCGFMRKCKCKPKINN